MTMVMPPVTAEDRCEAAADPQVAQCPFCEETFPSFVITDHCNYCVDVHGLADEMPAAAGRSHTGLADPSLGDADGLGKLRLPGGAPGSAPAGPGSVINSLRGMVSQNKIRFQHDGFDLDLTHITPRIIAMGFPSHGTEGYYRNPIEEVERFFESRHRGRYKVYNLCSERHYDHNNRFFGAYQRFPFDDHNAPALGLIPRFVKDATDFLKQDPQNIVAIHCKAGKGRTGVMVSALLMETEHSLRKADDALRLFGDLRTYDGKGVTIPSQIRYVRYYEALLAQGGRLSGKLPEARRVRLDKVVVHSAIKQSGGCDPYFIVLDGPTSTELFDSRKKPVAARQHQVQKDGKEGYEWDFAAHARDIYVSGDIKFVFKSSGSRMLFRSDDYLFHFWVNTSYLPDVLRLDKKQLDKACKDTNHDTYREDLEVVLACSPSSAAAPSSTCPASTAARHHVPPLDRARLVQ